ncbi:hypothetical protein P9869_38345 [Streptomyces ossamyceticus]|nr:hypothetical protein [Streptomyces ossamyceticus]
MTLDELDGAEFRVFGQDGTGVVARDLGDLLWLLADGFGRHRGRNGHPGIPEFDDTLMKLCR